MISTKKKNAVSHIIESSRHFLPEYLAILEKLQEREIWEYKILSII